MGIECVSSIACFGGEQRRYRHFAETTQCDMYFSVYLPPKAALAAVPVVYWLSGLTCTDENFVTKAGAQRYAAEFGVALVAPDTSPRGGVSPMIPTALMILAWALAFMSTPPKRPGPNTTKWLITSCRSCPKLWRQ